MNVRPGSTHDLVEEWGVSGATVGAKLILNDDGSEAIARVVATAEVGTSGTYRWTDFGPFPDEAGDYTLIFNDDGTTYAADHISTRDVVVTSSAPDDEFTGDTYATVEELAAILKIRTPTDEQSEKLERALVAAAGEINSEIDFAEDDALAGWELALAAEVNLARAAEHWEGKTFLFGLAGLGSELGATPTSRDTWTRHAMKLAPLKRQWGVA